ncbi:cysteine hydrolase family protein [Acrocarpospora catenulata]|uniref:cysteine hydrolase family protein n=1 Tax=Acrocarpospora catenulata TaxID=2836182 RepID=UPI001BDA482B|nr:cysteine hydrolase [Acrocarpospora catenulata]
MNPVLPDSHTAPNFASSALITIDVQRDFLSDSPYGIAGTTEILPAIQQAVTAYRQAARPVIHIIRLYEVGGANADLVRRTLLETGVNIAAPGTPGSELAPGLSPGPNLAPDVLLSGRPQQLGPKEYAVFKPRWGAFYRTALEDLLTQLRVDTLVFSGCNLPNCPRASMIEASERDYRVVLLRDAVSRVSESALDELAGIGVHPMTVEELTKQL